jgi:hypothetical protein
MRSFVRSFKSHPATYGKVVAHVDKGEPRLRVFHLVALQDALLVVKDMRVFFELAHNPRPCLKVLGHEIKRQKPRLLHPRQLGYDLILHPHTEVVPVFDARHHEVKSQFSDSPSH